MIEDQGRSLLAREPHKSWARWTLVTLILRVKKKEVNFPPFPFSFPYKKKRKENRKRNEEKENNLQKQLSYQKVQYPSGPVLVSSTYHVALTFQSPLLQAPSRPPPRKKKKKKGKGRVEEWKRLVRTMTHFSEFFDRKWKEMTKL